MAVENDDALVARLVPKVLSAIRASSTQVSTIQVKDSLDGITSIPCYDTTGGQYRKVLLAMTTLSDLSIKASEEALVAVDGERQENERIRIANENTRISNEENRAEQFSVWAEHGVNHPKIGENGNWWFWSETEGQYLDSGVLAQGGIFMPEFDINDNMELLMTSGESDLGGFEYDENTGNLYYLRP